MNSAQNVRLALHFNADLPTNCTGYDIPCYELVFRAWLECDPTGHDIGVKVGDVGFWDMTSDGLREWAEASKGSRFVLSDGLVFLRSHNIFCIVLDGLPLSMAQRLDSALLTDERYVGAIEVNTAHAGHGVYSLVPFCRILGTKCRLFWDDRFGDAPDQSMLRSMKGIGFSHVEFETCRRP
jgi:hypothetical protein